MTDKQAQKIRGKIEKIKKALIAEKRKFGGFDDSRGLRYLPTGLYVQIGDYDGGLKYLKWFNKNFPNDMGFPEFLFEAAIIYFKTGRLDEAEKATRRTYFANTFLFDKYFSRPLRNLDRKVSANFQQTNYLENFSLRHDQNNFLDFSDWLHRFIHSDKFLIFEKEFDDIERQLETEPVGRKRTMLVKKLYKLI